MIARRMKRVLMTADAVGGVWTYALELCGALDPLGVEVVLAAIGPAPSPAQRRAAAALPNVTLHEHVSRLEWMEDPWADVDAAGAWLLDLEARTRPDVVHLGSFCHGALPWRAPRIVVAHSCIGSWWQAVHGEPAPVRYRTYAERVRAGLAAADVVVAPTAAMLDAICRLYGQPQHGLVIRNTRTHTAFRPGRKETVIVGAGRVWDAAKNLTALDDVARLLPWPVKIAGDLSPPGGAATSLRHAEWLGVLPAERVRDVLAGAAIYALPARYEPFGLSIQEAALSGCALVLGDIPSLRELWDGAAMFVAPDDRHALAASLRRLIASPALRTALGQLARARARTWTPAAMAAAYVDCYRHASAALVA